MRILAIDSSAVAASAAILYDGKIIGENYINMGLTHSQTMLVLIDSLLKNLNLKLSDIDILAVSAGPGSFTGIRIGISVIKGLAFPNDMPCYAISTLEGLAYCVNLEDYLICPVMDARCSQVYTALFNKKDDKIIRISDDMPLKLEELAEIVNKTSSKIILIGDGADITYKYFSENNIKAEKFSENFKYQHASGVALAAYNMYNNGVEPIDGETLLPIYLRLSQAEREYKNRSK